MLENLIKPAPLCSKSYLSSHKFIFRLSSNIISWVNLYVYVTYSPAGIHCGQYWPSGDYIKLTDKEISVVLVLVTQNFANLTGRAGEHSGIIFSITSDSMIPSCWNSTKGWNDRIVEVQVVKLKWRTCPLYKPCRVSNWGASKIVTYHSFARYHTSTVVMGNCYQLLIFSCSFSMDDIS